MTDLKQLNGLVFAYIGDAIYEVYIRQHLLSKGLTKVNDLQKHSKQFVSAKAHAALYRLMESDQILTDEEIDYFKRGRNADTHTKAKNTDIVTYKVSTGVESMLGYLYLTEQTERLETLVNWMIKQVEDGRTLPKE